MRAAKASSRTSRSGSLPRAPGPGPPRTRLGLWEASAVLGDRSCRRCDVCGLGGATGVMWT